MKLIRFALVALVACLASSPIVGWGQTPGGYQLNPSLYNQVYGPGTSTADAVYASYASGHVGDLGCSSCAGGCADCGQSGACGTGCQCAACRSWNTWGSIDYLMWWAKGRSVPPLVTTSPQSTPRDDAGVLDPALNTTILFGNGDIGTQMQSGGRIDLGTWLTPGETLGLGLRVYALEGASTSFAADSPNANPILAQPFYNILQNQEDALLVAFPGVATGNIGIEADTEFWASEGYARILFDESCCYRLDLIVGYHYARLNDSLAKRDIITSIDPAAVIPVGTTFDIADVFETRNEFNGGEVGFLHETRRGMFSVTTLAKLSVGQMRQTATINGRTIVTEPNAAAVTSAGGLYSQNSNIGQYERIHTAVIPEIGINLGVDLTCRLRATFGYTFIWINDVALAGDQIDRAVNLSQAQGGALVGAARPAFAFQTTDYWMQGMNFGLNWDF